MILDFCKMSQSKDLFLLKKEIDDKRTSIERFAFNFFVLIGSFLALIF
jgi:hypothetical protein